MLSSLKKAISGFLLFSVLFVGVPLIASAATSPYSALRVTTTGNGQLVMAPGEVKDITLTFQNKGDKTWVNDGPGYISLYTHGPKYRASVFDPGTWLSPSQVRRLRETSVKPSGTGTVQFTLKAPQTPGTYKETFALAAEHLAWVTGGDFTLNITVAPTPASVPVTSNQQPATNSSAGISGYSASLVTQSAAKLKVMARKTVSFTAVVKNTGTTTWKNVGLTTPGASDFRHLSWQGQKVASLVQKVKPGESVTVQFFFTSPNLNGLQTAKFQITADDLSIPGAFVEIPVEVTGGSGEVANAPAVETVVTPVLQQIDEPTLRVGVLIVDEETKNEVAITSHESDFDLLDVDGVNLGSYKKGTVIQAAWDGDTYVYNDGSRKKSSKALRFVPKTANAVMTIANFDRRVTRGTSYANNTFRNVLELRYNTAKDRTWVINELPIELYLRGLAETSDLSHPEFQKTLMTAARTYAFYHWTHSSKHRAEGFHVDAYRDQVYWGYDQEARTPRITAGVIATRGQIVTHNGDTVITSYFSRSDGRTRDWSEVWGGNIPYSKSVPVPCDVGKTLWGHGVGMSASGAICMAKEGKDWLAILKYFYTGVEINPKW